MGDDQPEWTHSSAHSRCSKIQLKYYLTSSTEGSIARLNLISVCLRDIHPEQQAQVPFIDLLFMLGILEGSLGMAWR